MMFEGRIRPSCGLVFEAAAICYLLQCQVIWMSEETDDSFQSLIMHLDLGSFIQ